MNNGRNTEHLIKSLQLRSGEERFDLSDSRGDDVFEFVDLHRVVDDYNIKQGKVRMKEGES
jgi:hypothetical protein